MLRGYRLLIVATWGATILTAFGIGLMLGVSNYPDEQRHQPYLFAAVQPKVIEPETAEKANAQALQFRAPCDNPKGQGESDLCAQWRAAKAAENSAFWAKWSFWAAVFGVLGLAVTLWFNLEAWMQAASSRKETEAALAHAGRSADAMAKVAKTLQDQAKLVAESAETNKRIADAQQTFAVMQLRAYLSVVVGAAIYQEKGRNLRFEAKPQIINSGSTAAKALSYSIKAAILPYPPPDDIEWDLPPVTGKQGFIPPHQDRIITAVVNDFIDDERVRPAMVRQGYGLYVWGKVIYKDAFDNDRETNFGQSLYWITDSEGKMTIMGEYIPGRNDAT